MEENSNMKIYNAVCRPPKDALKQIGAGRLKGMTDINPQWRIKALTEQFGPCGVGWYYERTNYWCEASPDGEVMVFVDIALYIKVDGEWSKAIPGSGGSMMVAREKANDYSLPFEKERGYKLFASDEAVKMATTDALSVACKLLGIGGDIYAGRWDGSKYKDAPPEVKHEERFSDATLKGWMGLCDSFLKKEGIDAFRDWYKANEADIITDCGEEGAAKVKKHWEETGKKAAEVIKEKKC